MKKIQANGFISVPFNLLLSWVSSTGDEKGFVLKQEYAVDLNHVCGKKQKQAV